MPLISTFGAASLSGYQTLSGIRLVSETLTSGNNNFSIPSSAAVGDIAVLVDFVGAPGSVPTTAVPAGWTSVVNTADAAVANWRAISSYKLLVAGDPGATFSGMSGFSFNRKILLVFRNASNTSTVSAFSAAGEITAGDPTAQVVTSSGGIVPVIVIAFYGSGGTITGETFTPARTGEFSPNAFNIVAYKFFLTAPVNVTVDMGDYGTNVMQSYYLQIS